MPLCKYCHEHFGDFDAIGKHQITCSKNPKKVDKNELLEEQDDEEQDEKKKLKKGKNNG